MHAAIVLLVLILTYIGMAAGRVAWLQLDRTGIALLAVIVLLASRQMTLDDFGSAVDMPTVALLFAMMIISAQFAESGFLDRCAAMMTAPGERGGLALLALTVAIAGGLAAVLANDIVIVAIAPPLIAGAQRRGLDPRPLLIALAAATNAGSAATLIGNPQNIVLGELGNLGFWRFLAICIVPAGFSLAVVFAVVALQWRGRLAGAAPVEPVAFAAHPFDRFQAVKGAVAVVALLLLFVTSLPRETGALIIAALLLANRKITSRTMIAAVDWPLLLLVSCLFGLTGALNQSGVAADLLAFLGDHNLLPHNLVLLTPLTLATSSAIGSVPSALLLLQLWPTPPQGVLYAAALLWTLSGNLLLSGSLTNLLLAERAERMGTRLGFAEHARAGVPITLLSVGFAVIWLALTGVLPLIGG